MTTRRQRVGKKRQQRDYSTDADQLRKGADEHQHQDAGALPAPLAGKMVEGSPEAAYDRFGGLAQFRFLRRCRPCCRKVLMAQSAAVRVTLLSSSGFHNWPPC